MDRVEFTGLYAMYGWRHVETTQWQITIAHENGVTIQISIQKIYHMNTEDAVRLLKTASKPGVAK